MRRIIACINLSLDGRIEGANQELDWHRTNTPEHWQELETLLAGADALLFGRRTYELFAGFWPEIIPDEASPGDQAFAEFADAVEKIVVSTTLTEAEWAPARILRDPRELAAIKAGPGKNIVVFGGASLIGALTNLRLIDEYWLDIHPVVLGAGTLLFDAVNRQELRLLEAKPMASGVVMARYVPA